MYIYRPIARCDRVCQAFRTTQACTLAPMAVTALLHPRTPMAVKLSAKLCLALPMPCRHREPAHCANGYTGAGFFLLDRGAVPLVASAPSSCHL